MKVLSQSMPWKTAEAIKISEKEREILTKLSLGTSVKLNIKTRATIILKASEGISINKTSNELHLNRITVKHWRDKYQDTSEHLQKMQKENPRKLRAEIVKVLSDEQRSGKPPEFTLEQRALIIALACQNPEDLGLPFSHWTNKLLKEEAISRKIVNTISTSQVNRFLKQAGFEASQSAGMAQSKH